MAKILHVITDLSPDGAQRTLLRLVSHLDGSRYQNRIVSLMPGGHLESAFELAGIKVVTLGMKRGLPGPLVFKRLRSAILDFEPDILQGWMYHGNVAALAGAWLARTKPRVAWNIRRALYDQGRDKLLTRSVIKTGAFLSKQADAIIYCVGIAAEQHSRIGFANNNAITIPNGFDTARFSPERADRERILAELGLHSDAVLVGIVGRYHPQKDYPTFFRAARLALMQLPDLHFVLAGRGMTMDNPEVRALVEDLGLQSRVSLLGERQDIPRVVASLDLFVSSSENEGFSNVVGEAMACGIPCVATDAGASRELLEGLGTVVPRGSPGSLADAIVETVSLPTHIREDLGRRIRDRIVSRYSLQSMVESYSELYEDLVGVEPAAQQKAA